MRAQRAEYSGLRRTNHAAFFSLLMSSLRKNGRLGDPALPSLSSNSFHVRTAEAKGARRSSRDLTSVASTKLLNLFENYRDGSAREQFAFFARGQRRIAKNS
jgi:hypothetical protein